MAQKATNLSFDWEEEPEIDAEQEYRSLLRALQRKTGFGLLFVRCSPAAGTRLIDRVQTDLPHKTIGVLSFDGAIADGNFYRQVENFFEQQGAKEILFVRGLEYSLTSYEETQRTEANWSSEEIYNYSWKAVPRLLGNLNLRREKFRDNFATCFVFLLPLFALKYLTRRAPDFFDWRSGVFELPSDEKTVVQQSLLIYLGYLGAKDEYRSWSQAQRDRQIIKIQSWLDEPNQKPDLQADLLIQQGVLFSISGKYVAAIASYDQALKVKPDNGSAWYNRSNSLYELGRYEEAIASYDQALKVKPDDDSAWYNRGNALNELGRYEEAIASYDQALKIRPDNDSAWYNRGTSLYESRRYEEAIASYNQALKIKPDEYSLWYNQGVAFQELGRHEEAISSYDQALKLKSDDYPCWYNRGVALNILGRYEEAIASFDKALKIKPDDQIALNSRSLALSTLELYQEAIANSQN
jgi:tetratricopeptide (TPR) repeat protein